MKVCFPVLKSEGLASEVYGHFGTAPVFLFVETDGSKITIVDNKDQHHEHGACNPMKALDNQKVDAIVVGGIGAGALNRLNQLGIKVFRANALTVKENLALLKVHNLSEFAPHHTCAGHGHASGCGH